MQKKTGRLRKKKRKIRKYKESTEDNTRKKERRYIENKKKNGKEKDSKLQVD